MGPTSVFVKVDSFLCVTTLFVKVSSVPMLKFLCAKVKCGWLNTQLTASVVFYFRLSLLHNMLRAT